MQELKSLASVIAKEALNSHPKSRETIPLRLNFFECYKLYCFPYIVPRGTSNNFQMLKLKNRPTLLYTLYVLDDRIQRVSHQDSEDFTVYIKNSVAFPHFGEQFRKNNLPGKVLNVLNFKLLAYKTSFKTMTSDSNFFFRQCFQVSARTSKL